jgi:hypothetical protein
MPRFVGPILECGVCCIYPWVGKDERSSFLYQYKHILINGASLYSTSCLYAYTFIANLSKLVQFVTGTKMTVGKLENQYFTFDHAELGPMTGLITPQNVVQFRAIPYATIPARFKRSILLESISHTNRDFTKDG